MSGVVYAPRHGGFSGGAQIQIALPALIVFFAADAEFSPVVTAGSKTVRIRWFSGRKYGEFALGTVVNIIAFGSDTEPEVRIFRRTVRVRGSTVFDRYRAAFAADVN